MARDVHHRLRHLHGYVGRIKVKLRRILIAFLPLLFLVLAFARPVYAQAEMREFFQILIYGDASWFYLIILLGIGFLISWIVRPFALVMMVACVFIMIDYASQEPNTPYVWRIILLMVGATIFLLRLAKVSIFED